MSSFQIPLTHPYALSVALSAYRSGASALREFTAEQFPPGTVVNVNNARFRGIGFTRYAESCPPDHVAVCVESGNTWWYPIEDVTRNRNVKTWPRFVRQMKLPRAIIN